MPATRRRTVTRYAPRRRVYSRPVYASRRIRRVPVRRYTGRGAYQIRAPRSAAYGRQIGTGVGSLLSLTPARALAPLASTVLGYAGERIGNTVGKYMGWGGYTVKKNTISEGTMPPYMHNSGKTVRHCHREYLGDIITDAVAGAFKLQSFQVNAANAQSCPWFWRIAANFQKYRIHGAVFDFESASGDALTAGNTALGTVIMASNYNCADDNFQTRFDMENTQYTVSAKPSQSFTHIIECDPAMQTQNSLYTAINGIPSGNTSDNECNWVNFQIATVGMQAASVNIGSLYFKFDIELLQPVSTSANTAYLADWFGGTGNFAPGAPLGTVITNNPNNSLGGDWDSGQIYIFPSGIMQGLFRFTYYYIPADNSDPLALPNVGAFVNCQATTGMWDGTAYTIPAVGTFSNGVAGPGMTATYLIRVTGLGAQFEFIGGTFDATAGGIASVMVEQIDGDFAPPP